MAYSYRTDSEVPDFKDDKPVIVFDGHCVLCSVSARFVIKHDTKKRYRLLAAQTPIGEALYRHYGMKSGDYDTIILLEDGSIKVKSDAALAIGAGLHFPWSLSRVLRIVPKVVRDWVYDLTARNRISWFGRSDTCFLPPPDERDRFL